MNTVDDLKDRIQNVDPTGTAALLRAKSAELVSVMIPRERLSNGDLGFKAEVHTTITLKLGNDPAADTPSEKIKLVAPCSEIRFEDPVLTLDGAVRVALETLTYDAVGISEKLWPGEQIRLRVGRVTDPMLRPTFGRFEVPPLVTFGVDRVVSVQEVYLTADTPLGRLHNVAPAQMHCALTQIPPIGEPYVQQGVVPLFDEQGVEVAMKTTTDSEIVGLV